MLAEHRKTALLTKTQQFIITICFFKYKKKEEQSSILQRQIAIKFQITACNRIFDIGSKIVQVSINHYVAFWRFFPLNPADFNLLAL